jgi:hypothetical protein
VNFKHSLGAHNNVAAFATIGTPVLKTNQKQTKQLLFNSVKKQLLLTQK